MSESGNKKVQLRKRPMRVFRLYVVDWPNNVFDFRKPVAVRRRREIAQRLIAYLLFPPPVPAGPGGRRRKGAKGSGKKQKKKDFDKARLKVRHQLVTYWAFETARLLASYERKIEHHGTSSDYNAAFEDFRRLSGFRRLLSTDGGTLASRDIGKAKWSELVGAFLVFDLIARYAQQRKYISENQARFVVLLCQDLHGVKLNHSRLSQACLEYRAVQHLLVAILGICFGPTEELGQYKRSQKGKRSIPELRKVLTSRLGKVLARAKQLQLLIQNDPMRAKNSADKDWDDLVRLPEELLVTRAGRLGRSLDIEDKLLGIYRVDWQTLKNVPNGAKSGPNLEKDVTSSSAKSTREALLKAAGLLSGVKLS